MRQGLQVMVIFPWAQYGLPLNERMLPKALKEVGYETFITGKWHLGHFDKAYLPLQRGFDHQYGFYNGAIGYFSHDVERGLDWQRNEKSLSEPGYSTDLIGDEAVRIIKKHDRKKPFFLYIPFNAPHAPLQATDKYLSEYADIKDPMRKTYAAMVSALDAQVGRIVDALDEQSLTQKTLVIFFQR